MKKLFILLSSIAILTAISTLTSCQSEEKKDRSPENTSYSPGQAPDSEYPGSKQQDTVRHDDSNH